MIYSLLAIIILCAIAMRQLGNVLRLIERWFPPKICEMRKPRPRPNGVRYLLLNAEDDVYIDLLTGEPLYYDPFPAQRF